VNPKWGVNICEQRIAPYGNTAGSLDRTIHDPVTTDPKGEAWRINLNIIPGNTPSLIIKTLYAKRNFDEFRDAKEER
jgi:hypothetical protein